MSAHGSLKLVLLPGLDGTGKLFAPLIKQLPKGVDPHVISYPSDRCQSIDELAARVLKQLPDGKFVLLAESFSGLVAFRLLPHAAPRLQALIFAGAFATSPRPWLLGLAALFPFAARGPAYAPNGLIRLFCLGANASKEACREFRTVLAEVQWQVLAHRIGLIAAARPPDVIALECACYYVQGKSDRLVPSSAVKWFQAHIRNLQVLKVAAPHLMLQAAPKECAEAINFARLSLPC